MFIEPSERIETSWVAPRASLFNRFIAKFLDFLVVAILYEIPLKVSFLIGVVYLLLADGVGGGSIGKRLIGLKIMTMDHHGPISFRASIIRNAPFVVAFLFYNLPLIGWLVTLAIVAFESFLMIGNPRGIRAGDELAKTFVLDWKGT